MDTFVQAIERTQELRALVMGLMLGACLVAAWFPGHNAERWGHGAAAVVRRAGWLWCLVSVSLSMGGLISLAWPVLLMLWVVLAVWSYGKAAMPVGVARHAGHGFEVLSSRSESYDPEDIPTAAIAS